MLIAAIHVKGQDKGLSKGREIFVTYCSRCHGMTGAGGEGPALNRSYLPRAVDDATFARVISWGIPGTGMQGLWMLSETQVNQVIKYVRSIGTVKEDPVTGDPLKGLALFQKSNCLSCHSVKGKGSNIGPDLSGVGTRRGNSYLNEMLVEPGKLKIRDEEGFIQFLVIEVKTRDGKLIHGLRVNEDTYTIQMKDVEGRLYSFRKENLASIKRIPESSLMPSFAKTLTHEERQDIVAYLLTQK